MNEMKCAGCLKNLNKDTAQIKCMSSGCGKIFCSPCINITGLSAERKKSWKCPDCAALKKKGDNSQTPVQPTYDSMNVTLRRKPEYRDSPTFALDTKSDVPAMTSEEVHELMMEIRGLTKELSCVKLKLTEATASLTKCHERLDSLSITIGHHENRISNLETQELETKMLKATIADLKFDLNKQTQNNLKNELEILGIEEHQNENLQHIVMVTGRKLGVDLTDQDIDWVTRVGPRKQPATVGDESDLPKLPRPIVIRLLRRAKRDQLLKSSKVRRNITSTDIDVQGTSRKVYINERLTKENRMLFRNARNISKKQGFAHCWCNQGALYVRRREGSPAQLVRS